MRLEPPVPSAYTPFFRRFSSEHARELEETRQLYAWVKAAQDTCPHTLKTIGAEIFRSYPSFSEDLDHALLNTQLFMMDDLPLAQELPPPDFERMNLEEFVAYKNLLRHKQYFYQNQDRLVPLIIEAYSAMMAAITEDFPALEEPSPFTIPLFCAIPSFDQTYRRITTVLGVPEYLDRGIFKTLSEQAYAQCCSANNVVPGKEGSRPLKFPKGNQFQGEAMVRAYLGTHPLAELYLTPVPLKLTHEDRFSHCHIVGGTGAGKTTLIENLVLHDLVAEDSPSLVIIEPHSDLVRKLARAALGIEDRLIVIDPRDIAFPPALNVFALNHERMKGYDDATREQVTAGVIQTFDYLFSGLIGADLTAKQGVLFRYIARLMLALPEALGRNATILDMLHLMSDSAPYSAVIASLPPLQREFFERDFAGKTFQQTKEQVRYRLQALLENPTLARLFTSPETKIDLFTEMNRGAVILVDTAKDFLKGASANFGRIFVSLVLQAILERAAIPASKRKATFLIVDEAASYFDSNIDDLLTEARKYRCGLVLAHQYLDQAAPALRASLAANAASKFACGLSAGDARAMAHDMRTSAEFILDQPRLQFAAHIRNVTPHAVSIPVRPVGALPQMSEEAFAALMTRNRERVALPAAPAEVPVSSAHTGDSPQSGNPDISETW